MQKILCLGFLYLSTLNFGRIKELLAQCVHIVTTIL